MSGGVNGSRRLPIEAERNIGKAGRKITEYSFYSDWKGRGKTNRLGSNRSG
jgi:hypothetical protein